MTGEQLELRAPCPGCGSRSHDGCGYDPEQVKPVMSVAEALSLTIAHSIETHGFDGACRRMPGLRYWGESPEDAKRRVDAAR